MRRGTLLFVAIALAGCGARPIPFEADMHHSTPADLGVGATTDLAPAGDMALDPNGYCSHGWRHKPITDLELFQARNVFSDRQHRIHLVGARLGSNDNGDAYTRLDEPGATLVDVGPIGTYFSAATNAAGAMDFLANIRGAGLVNFGSPAWMTQPFTRSVATTADYEPLFDVDPSGALHVLFYSTATGQMQATNASGAWVTSSFSTGSPSASYWQLIIDNAGIWHLLGSPSPAGTTIYADNSSGSFVEEVAPCNGPLLVADDGTPHLADLVHGKHAWKSGGAWMTETAPTVPSIDGLSNPPLALDTHGHVHAAWRASVGIAYATNQSGTWQQVEISFPDLFNVQGPIDTAVVTDAADAPHIFPVGYPPPSTNPVKPTPVPQWEVTPDKCP